MSLIDIKAVKAEAAAQIAKEFSDKAKTALVNQMRVVARAEQALAGERLKLADIEAQIGEGTL